MVDATDMLPIPGGSANDRVQNVPGQLSRAGRRSEELHDAATVRGLFLVHVMCEPCGTLLHKGRGRCICGGVDLGCLEEGQRGSTEGRHEISGERGLRAGPCLTGGGSSAGVLCVEILSILECGVNVSGKFPT